MRIGFASDIHRLVEGRKFILGGVTLDYPLGELAHSDGDVVYHAVAESILGALALGDLGKHFPDNSNDTLDMDSSIIVLKVVEMMETKGFEINNIDISIYLEKPKLSSFIELMRVNLAKLLKTHIENISIKACTNEKLDSIGSGLAVKADAIALLKKKGE